MNTVVKQFAKDHFPDAKSDLFACFIERGYTLAKGAGHTAMVTMQSWMFLSSFQKMRERILLKKKPLDQWPTLVPEPSGVFQVKSYKRLRSC